MGWTEPHGPSAEMVRRLEQRNTAMALAKAVSKFLGHPSCNNREHLEQAHTAFVAAVDPVPVINPNCLRVLDPPRPNLKVV